MVYTGQAYFLGRQVIWTYLITNLGRYLTQDDEARDGTVADRVAELL